MSDAEITSSGDSVSRTKAITAALGGAFAKALAVYTVEVLELLEDRGLRLSDFESNSPAPTDAESQLRSAPKWVRAAYERAKKVTQRSDAVESEERSVQARIIRNRLMLALHRANITQADLANRLGKSASGVSRIFRNPERSRLRTLQAIAKALRVDLSDILDQADSTS